MSSSKHTVFRGRSAVAWLVVVTLLLPIRAHAAVTGALAGIETYVEQMMVAWQVPGVALVVVKDGETLISQGFGVREVGQPGKVDRSTMFAIGSASKAFTAASLCMLSDQGVLSLTEPVQNFYPEFRVKDDWVSANITLVDMLSHRTGVMGRDMLWVWKAGDRSRAQLVSRLSQCPEDYPFRAWWDYNNLMFLAAGQVIPKVSGQTWDAFVRERIFKPLGMTSSNTSVRLLTGDNVASPHWLVQGVPTPIPYRNIDNIAPAGAINSNIADMEQWVRFQLNDGVVGSSTLLSPSSIATMRTDYMALPIPPGGTDAFPHANFVGYGLGWFLHDYRGELVVEHGGNIDGMTSLVAMIPDQGIGLAILTNMQGSRIREVLMYRIFDMLLGVEPEDWNAHFRAMQTASDEAFAAEQQAIVDGRASGTHPTLALSAYTGRYTNPIYGVVHVGYDAAEGQLALTYQNRRVLLDHWEYDSFQRPYYSMETPGIELVKFTVDSVHATALEDDVMGEFTRIGQCVDAIELLLSE